MSLPDVFREHLEHVRHIEEERALLLGLYGALSSILIANAITHVANRLISSMLMCVAFIISLFFLLIVFKVDEEFIKHWRALRVYALKLMCEECKKLPDLNKYVNVFEIAALFPLKRRRLSVHRLTESLIVFIASFTIIYAVTYVVSPSNAELVFIASIGGAIAIAILYYLLLERLLPCGPEHPVGVWVSRGCKVYVEPGVHGIDIPIDDEDLRAFKETAKRLCDEMAKTCKEVETN